MTYDDAVARTRRPLDPRAAGDGDALLHELVRCATLAASSHNTQCWRFRIAGDVITILPDFARRCAVVDPDDHHLYVSLGCATENLVQAAGAWGRTAEPQFDAAGRGAVRVTLARGGAASPLAAAIPDRQCTRSEYSGQALDVAELKRLEVAGTGRGVRVLLLTESAAMELVLEYVAAGNTAQLDNPAFVRELVSWIRFSDAEAVRTGDGLAGRAAGSPSVPRWLGTRLLPFLLRPRTENDRCARQVRSSAGIAVFVSDADDRVHQVEAGRCYQRFALQATALGIRNAFLNQPVEEAGLRPAFAAALGLAGGRPDLVVRFGRARPMPHSLRRPVSAVLDAVDP